MNVPPFCFFCGGNTRTEFWATPRPYEPLNPCDACRSIVNDDHVAIFEVVETDPGCENPQFKPGVWYTGRWTVLLKELVTPMFGNDLAQGILSHGYACLRADNYAKAKLDKYVWRLQ